MFEQRVAGRSVAGIARELNERGVPCPSDVDPQRNHHRAGGLWTLRTVAVILANPRYTGRQVWNRQRSEHSGRDVRHRTNPSDVWTISKTIAHPPLVSEAEFVAAQQVRAARPTKDGSPRSYRLAGLVECGLCGRRMDSHWVHGRAGYRCRHGHTSARPRRLDQPRTVYVREDLVVDQLAAHFSPARGELISVLQVRDDEPNRITRIVAYLQAEELVIVHNRTGWDLTPQ
jgi:site-specific DNA recombinase